MAAFIRKDHYHKKAKDEGYRSRAAYKLQELDKRFRLFRKRTRVLDLGAAPGGWLQVASQAVGPKGKVVGIDLLDIPPLGLANVEILLGDMRNPEMQEQIFALLGGPAHTVLSDMAPNISGIRSSDCARSYELSKMALDLASVCLRRGGHFVVKIFPGDDFELFLKQAKSLFRKVKTTRPDATRRSSSEVYVICTDFKGRPPKEEVAESTEPS